MTAEPPVFSMWKSRTAVGAVTVRLERRAGPVGIQMPMAVSNAGRAFLRSCVGCGAAAAAAAAVARSVDMGSAVAPRVAAEATSADAAMPTTRAARRAAAARLIELPADALGLVLYQLPLAHDIAAVAPTCRALDDAGEGSRPMRRRFSRQGR